jgi:hypothetical protein
VVVDFLGGPPQCGVWCNGRLAAGCGHSFALRTVKPCLRNHGSQLRTQMEYYDSSVILIGLAHDAHGKVCTIQPQSQVVDDVPFYLDLRHDKLALGRL